MWSVMIVIFTVYADAKKDFNPYEYKYGVAILSPLEDYGQLDLRIHSLDDVIITISNGVDETSSQYNLTQERYHISLPVHDHKYGSHDGVENKSILIASPSQLDIYVTSCNQYGQCSGYHVPAIHTYATEFYAVVWSPEDYDGHNYDTDHSVNMITVMATEYETQTQLWRKTEHGYEFKKLITLNALQTYTHHVHNTTNSTSHYKITSNKPIATYSSHKYSSYCHTKNTTICNTYETINCTTESSNCTIDASNCTIGNNDTSVNGTDACSANATICYSEGAANCTIQGIDCLDPFNCTINLTNCTLDNSTCDGVNCTNCTFPTDCTICTTITSTNCTTTQEKIDCTTSYHTPVPHKHQLGTEHLVPVTQSYDNETDDGFHLRIISISDDNYVTIHYQEHNETSYEMNAGDHYDIYMHANGTDNSTWALINCTYTCVVSKIHGYSNNTNYTQHTVNYVPHLHDAVHSFVFSSDNPHYENFTTKLTILAHDDHKDHVKLDGYPVSDGTTWSDVPTAQHHKVLVKDIEPGTHYVTSGRVTKTFQAYVDGYPDLAPSTHSNHYSHNSFYSSHSLDHSSTQHSYQPATVQHYQHSQLKSESLKTHVTDVHGCMTTCYATPNCVSVVYDKDTHICELHDVIQHSVKNYMEHHPSRDVYSFK